MRSAVRGFISLGAAVAVVLAGSAPPTAAQPAVGVEGVWYGLRSDGLSGKVKADHYTFLSDGRAFRNQPTGGLVGPVDWAAECRYAECGAYTRRGATIVFKNSASGGSTEFTLDGEGVLRKANPKTSYRRMHLLEGRLNGTWGVFDPDGGPPVVTIAFEPGGRFREAGLLHYTSWAALAPSGESRREVARGEGAYSIRRGTLDLRYDAGPVARFFLATPPAVPPGPSPATIQLGGARLERAP